MCGTDNRAVPEGRYTEGPWLLKDCPTCGMVYVEPTPVYDELRTKHSWGESAVRRDRTRARRYPLLHTISKCTRWRLHLFPRKRAEKVLSAWVSSGRVLDIGCGKGDHLRRLAHRYTPYGIEISEAEASHAIGFAREREGDVIVAPAIDGLRGLPDAFAQGVIMRSYLEHEAQPLPVLHEVFRILRPGGVVIIKVPNYGCWNRRLSGRRWCGFRFPDHLNYFTPASLQQMCLTAGFAIRRFGFFDRSPSSDNMWMVAGRS